MKENRKGFPGAAVALALIGGLLISSPLAAQGGKWHSVKGRAVVASVQSGTTSQQVQSDSLPSAGGFTQTDTTAVSVPGFVTADLGSAVSAGTADGSGLADAQSVSTASNVSILNGLITASRVIAVASASAGDRFSDAGSDGSSLTDLVVNGVSYGSGDVSPAPNTRVNLPGVGYAILNEQVQAKGSAVGLTVNMIHVVMQGATTGDIIVGSASSAAAR